MTEKVWPCAEITKDQANQWRFQSKTSGCYPTGWNQCPICFARRPEEMKKLAETLRDFYVENLPAWAKTKGAFIWDGVAEEAVRAFEEVIDDIKISNPYNIEIVHVSALKQKLRELIR